MNLKTKPVKSSLEKKIVTNPNKKNAAEEWPATS